MVFLGRIIPSKKIELLFEVAAIIPNISITIVGDGDIKYIEELKNYCLESLARFKVPAIFHCVAEFPTTKSPNGTKIQRTKLREIAEAAIQIQSES